MVNIIYKKLNGNYKGIVISDVHKIIIVIDKTAKDEEDEIIKNLLKKSDTYWRYKNGRLRAKNR